MLYKTLAGLPFKNGNTSQTTIYRNMNSENERSSLRDSTPAGKASLPMIAEHAPTSMRRRQPKKIDHNIDRICPVAFMMF